MTATVAAGEAVITGVGVVAPNGVGLEEYWRSTLAGISGIDTITRFDARPYPCRLAGEAGGFDAEAHVPRKLLPQTDHMTRMSLAAAAWALDDAGVDPARCAEYEMGVCTASSAGGFEFGQRELQKLWGLGPHHVSAYQSFAWFYAVNTGQISIRHGMRGPSGVLVAGQSGGLDVLAMARRRLRSHGSRVVLTGSVDSTLCPWGWTAHLARGGLSPALDPSAAYLPFDRRANGHVVGEGGAILVLQDSAALTDRTAGYAVLAGHAATFDGSGEPGDGLCRAAVRALSDAGIGAHDVDVVFADAAGDPEQDAAEAHVLRTLFGPHGVPVTAPKTMTGRLMSGGAPLDVVAAAMAVRHGVIPPTVNVSEIDPDLGIDLVRDPRPAKLRTALVLCRGEGGFNSAVVLTAL